MCPTSYECEKYTTQNFGQDFGKLTRQNSIKIIIIKSCATEQQNTYNFQTPTINLFPYLARFVFYQNALCQVVKASSFTYTICCKTTSVQIFHDQQGSRKVVTRYITELCYSFVKLIKRTQSLHTKKIRWMRPLWQYELSKNEHISNYRILATLVHKVEMKPSLVISTLFNHFVLIWFNFMYKIAHKLSEYYFLTSTKIKFVVLVLRLRFKWLPYIPSSLRVIYQVQNPRLEALKANL